MPADTIRDLHDETGATPLGHAPPLPPHDHTPGAPDGTGRKVALTGIAGLLVGIGAGFAVGRATAPKRRGLRLPFGGARRRAAFGAVKLAPVVARGTYRTGKTAGKGTVRLTRGAVRRRIG